MKSAGIKGYFTRHSLRVTAATRMYDAQLDEATIMSRTGHRSVDGLRAYKKSSEKLKELSSTILNAQKKPKLQQAAEHEEKKVLPGGAESENIPLEKPLIPSISLPGINFGSAIYQLYL